ncbi:MAG: hypothetical protein AAB566_01355, partial [Patescibacteria group bacterium]
MEVGSCVSMADQNQSSGFDLKIPPPNLPTGNIPPSPARPPAPPPSPLKPPQPSPTGPVIFSPPAPKTMTGTMPSPAPSPNIKSSIRTMQDDLTALGKGKPPIGITPERPISMVPKPSITPTSPVSPPRPVFAPPPPAGIPTSRPDTSGGVRASRPSSGISAQIAVPPTPKKPVFGRSGLLAILTVLIIGGFSLWFLVFYEPSPAVVESPTPSITVTPTPVVIPPLETVFTQVYGPIANVTPDLFASLAGLSDTQSLTLGDPALYKIGDPVSGEHFPFSQFASASFPNAPATLIAALNDGQFYASLMRKNDSTFSYGWIVKINDPAAAGAALRNWETTISNDLKNLFGLNVARAI